MIKPFTAPGDYRSGRGAAVPGGPPETWVDKDSLGDLPKPTPRLGQTGEPSSSFSVTASQIQQQGYEDDEIEYWADAAFDPPYLVHGDDMGQGHHHIREEALRAYVRRILEDIILGEYEGDEGEDVEEASSLGGGSIRGYITPLGTGGKEDQDERLDVAEKSFGDGKIKD